MSEPTILCILGMHRSGTSLFSRALNVLGVDLGPEEHLMGPTEANPTGHWENLPIKEINDEILERFGGTWFEPPDLPAGWEARPELSELRREAREVVEADFGGAERWAFKDPRTSLTLPFWQRILPPMRYLICFRNPLDVAASLQARKEDSVPFEEGIELWLRYVRASLGATAGHTRQLVFYEDLMAEPEPAVRDLARFAGIDGSDTAEADARAAIRVAVTGSLWHHRTPASNVVDATSLAFHVKAFYLALRQFVPGPEAIGAEVLDLLATYATQAGRRVAELEARRADLRSARERLESLQGERRALEERLTERTAELDQVATARNEEQRRRRDVEAELEAARAELARLQDPTSRDRPAGGERSESYVRLVDEVLARTRELIPSGATVLVAGKGDDELLQLDGCRAWHFPSDSHGHYAGYHPSGDTAAIAQLEALRARGADHLVLPATTLWWLDHYPELRRHLEYGYVPLLEDERCAIYSLRRSGEERPTNPIATLKRVAASARIRSGRDPSILDWGTDLEIADHVPELPVFAPLEGEGELPYLDGTIDIVVVSSPDPARLAEARRVASSAVIGVDAGADTAQAEWLTSGDPGWGEDVGVTLFPDGDEWAWEATLAALGETLENGYAGELAVCADAAALGRVSDEAGATGVQLRAVEVRAGASLAQRARTAADSANRQVQVFIAAPAVPLPDWLPSILDLFSGERDAGVVGARILSSLGTLEEAGGVVDRGGSRRARGNGDQDPDRPEYTFVRRVDFCSPPLLATRRDAFERVGGFDDRALNPSEVLVDFSLRAGRAGVPVYYQPGARVVSIENASR